MELSLVLSLLTPIEAPGIQVCPTIYSVGDPVSSASNVGVAAPFSVHTA